MRTALDMAKRLKQKSLTQVAFEVALLNHVALPKPLSLLAVMKLFAKVAVPEPPKNLVNEFKFPTESPTLSPIFSDVTWVDAGAKTFRHATRYRCRIALIYDGDDTAVLNENDSWTNSTEIVFQNELNFDTEYKASIIAWNDWGQSEWSWIKFETYDNPNPPSKGPGHPPPPPAEKKPSGILFWNCDTTSVSQGDIEHLPVYFWLFDLTAGTNWNQEVDAGYNDAGSCGPNFTNAQIVIPSSSTTSIVAGHKYQWKIVKPSNAGCGNTNDPNNSGCVVASGTFTAGNDAALVLPWANS